MQKAFSLPSAWSYGLAWLQLLDLKNSRLPFGAWHFIYFFKKNPEEQSPTTNRAAAPSLIGELPGAGSDNSRFFWFCSTWNSWPPQQLALPSWKFLSLRISLQNGSIHGKTCLLKMYILYIFPYTVTNSHQGKRHCLKSWVVSSDQLGLLLRRTYKCKT